jgi:hypothetical protein
MSNPNELEILGLAVNAWKLLCIHFTPSHSYMYPLRRILKRRYPDTRDMAIRQVDRVPLTKETLYEVEMLVINMAVLNSGENTDHNFRYYIDCMKMNIFEMEQSINKN